MKRYTARRKPGQDRDGCEVEVEYWPGMAARSEKRITPNAATLGALKPRTKAAPANTRVAKHNGWEL